MKVSDILITIIIIIIFLGLYVSNVLAIGIKKVQDNWPVYRCSPTVMPFAGIFGHDVGDNFNQCMQTTQTSYMEYLMLPMNYILKLVGNVASKIVSDINSVRGVMDRLRNQVMSIIQNTFGVLLNIVIGFQKIIISLRDLINKLVGVVMTLLYILQGAMFTMQSLWNGINGSLVRSLGSG
jgi:hypothetical protein